ncbi:Hypothetical_protein [Hexamita inflata]|uniref:Hypothetical_protein n=1 Tax=Hexamita inflata TaxID=28002 RepID=A0AA86NR06_9EUKA|nr:Hypothetical protein HINF_LOCUS12040 [Hexamita inflata]
MQGPEAEAREKNTLVPNSNPESRHQAAKTRVPTPNSRKRFPKVNMNLDKAQISRDAAKIEFSNIHQNTHNKAAFTVDQCHYFHSNRPSKNAQAALSRQPDHLESSNMNQTPPNQNLSNIDPTYFYMITFMQTHQISKLLKTTKLPHTAPKPIVPKLQLITLQKVCDRILKTIQ